MKIGVLTGEAFAFGVYGGFGYVARKTANLLKDLGHDVCIIDVSSRYEKTPTFLDEGIPIYFLVNKRIRLGPIDELSIAKNFLKRIPLDAIISISLYTCGKWAYYFKKASRKTKSLIWFQDIRTDDDWRKIFSNSLFWLDSRNKYLSFFFLHERYRRFLRKKGIETADGLITQAQLMRYKIEQLYRTRKNIELVPNPIPIPNEKDIKKSEKPTVIFLGRLDPIKRPWLFAEIATQFPNIDFLYLGESHFSAVMNATMEKYKKIKNLKFLGLTIGARKAEILSKAWVLVNPSVYESLPISFLEALSYKMAILSCQNPDNITSNYGFYTGEILGDGYNELPKFVEGLQHLLSNDRWLAKGEKGCKFVKNFADEKKIAKRLDQILYTL
jgi:glycosyltransferase involved in cell wall biosynthesis